VKPMQGNTRTYWPALAAIGSAFWLATACAPAAEDPDVSDAGSDPIVDAGGGGGGGGTALQEGESCSVANSECDTGLLCLPSPLNPSVGVCRVDCGLRNDQGQVIDEDPSKCSDTRSCLVVTDPSSFDVTAVACLPQATQRDGTCLAPGDEDACAAPMQCHVTYVADAEDPNDDPSSFNCKQTCDLDADDVNDGCPGDEACFRSNLIQGFEPDATGMNIKTCTLASCDEGGTDCECTEDFECIQLTTSEEGQGGCVSVPGVCGIAARGVTDADWEGSAVGDSFCNSVDDHLYCDNRPYEDLENPAENFCLFQGQLGAPYVGICYAFCSVPSVDLNNDGTLSDDEIGEDYQCGADQACYTDLGAELLIGPGPEDESATFGIKECDPANCTEGEACESECGPGDTQCITFESRANGTVSLCIAPYGNCEPVRDEPAVDAGVSDDAGDTTETDAGDTTETDAGDTTETDAGDTTETDAGDTTETDAGDSTETDGGVADDAGE
jgi:hypothetical protein